MDRVDAPQNYAANSPKHSTNETTPAAWRAHSSRSSPGNASGCSPPTNRRHPRRIPSERKGGLRRHLPTLIVGILIGAILTPWLFAAQADAPILKHIHHARSATWRYQRALGTCCHPYHHTADRSSSRAYRAWVLTVWRGRRTHAASKWHASAIRSALMCIHTGEGPWTDPDAPYYGGLQMDRSFASTYAPTTYRVKGTPDYWTPLEQLTAGARAVRVRGYSPWPNTRIPCGV